MRSRRERMMFLDWEGEVGMAYLSETEEALRQLHNVSGVANGGANRWDLEKYGCSVRMCRAPSFRVLQLHIHR